MHDDLRGGVIEFERCGWSRGAEYLGSTLPKRQEQAMKPISCRDLMDSENLILEAQAGTMVDAGSMAQLTSDFKNMRTDIEDCEGTSNSISNERTGNMDFNFMKNGDGVTRSWTAISAVDSCAKQEGPKRNRTNTKWRRMAAKSGQFDAL